MLKSCLSAKVVWKHSLLAIRFIKSSTCLICLCLLLLSGCQMPFFSGKKDTVSKPLNPCVVLALPASGPYNSISAKIRKGARIAQEDLKAHGTNLRLENVDTQLPNWLATLEALPPECAIVGGPLQEKSYLAASRSGIMDRRVFFSFMPTLQKGDEGKKAWRFFPSPQDQIDALVRGVADDLNIRTFGAFYPNDSYGSKMTALLEKTLSGRHIPLEKAAYNPAAPASWSSSAKSLIRPLASEGKNSPVPQTAFEALFVPDSWKHMDMITTSLMYNGEDRLALLGTTLWEQSLSGKQVPAAGKYALAIFPGTWNSAKAPQQLRKGDNDFWSALGFDFINFAVNTGITSRLESSAVTSRAQSASSHVRAMAPINWNSDGSARQNLYLFQVGPNGMTPLNVETFKQRRTAILDQAALRMQGIPSSPEPVEETHEPVVEKVSTAVETPPAAIPPEKTEATPAQPVLPRNQIMSPVPQPSYKLRLPSNIKR